MYRAPFSSTEEMAKNFNLNDGLFPVLCPSQKRNTVSPMSLLLIAFDASCQKAKLLAAPTSVMYLTGCEIEIRVASVLEIFL
jgi:hypothetical protein